MAINLQEIFDYVIPQPSYTGRLEKLGLLNAGDLKRAKNQSIAQGLLGAGLTYLATPKNQNYGSAAPYIAQAALGGLNAARKPVENLTEQALMNQKLNALEKTQTDETMTDKAFAQLISSTPELQNQGYEKLPASQKAELLKQYTGAQFKNMFDLKEIKPKTDRTMDVLNDGGTPNDPSDDFLDRVVSEFDPKATNDDGTQGAWKEINRSPKVMEQEALFSDNAANLYAEQYLLTGVFPPFGRGKHAASNRAKVTNIAANGAVRKGFVKKDPETGGILLDKEGQPVPDFEAFTADIQVNKAMIRDQSLSANRFSTGPQGNTIRSLNVGIDHLETFREFAEALNNKNVKDINRLRNKLALRLSNEDLAAFEVTKTIVSTEVAKAITGSNVMALDDRQAFGEQVRASQSYGELVAAIEAAQKLMAGQLDGLEQQYIVGTTPAYRAKNPFFISSSSDGVDGFVGKRTEEVLNRVRGKATNQGIEKTGLTLQNPNPADKEFIDMYLKNPNSETGKAIAKGLIQRGYTL